MSTADSSKPLKVLWLTNIATPYRIPVWRWFSGQVELTVGLLSNTEQNRWWNFTRAEIGLDCVFLEAPAIRYGERSIYLPGRKLRKILRTEWDVIILGGWESPAYIYALLVAKSRGIRTASHYGSTSKSHLHGNGVINRIRSWFYRQIDAHASYGTNSTDSLIAMGVNPERIFTGFNSVDHELFYNETNRLRKEIIPTSGHTFLYVGQLLPRKNVSTLIEAFNLIKDPEDSLRIVGSGPQEEQIREQIEALGLKESVLLVGAKLNEELFREYARGQSLVLPSSSEVWGLVANEALASGLHLIVSKSCGCADDVKHMQGVFLCDTTVESIAEALKDSRGAWSKPISEPEIVAITPAEYGRVFLQACTVNIGQLNRKA